jgi:hypothetical protein
VCAGFLEIAMSDLPEARLDELEDFSAPLFEYTAKLGFWLKVYGAAEARWRMKADALKEANGPPDRVKVYRHRAAKFATWMAAVGFVHEEFNRTAGFVATELGGSFAPDKTHAPAVFRMPERAVTTGAV